MLGIAFPQGLKPKFYRAFFGTAKAVPFQSRSMRWLLINHFEGELNLAGSAGGLADFAKAGAVKSVGRQSHIHDIEEVEEFRAELQVHPLGAAGSAAEGRVLDKCKIEVMVSRTAKGVAPER